MQLRRLIFVLFFFSVGLSAQTGTIIFPNLFGQQLLDALVQNYKPSSVLSYNDARDQMYAFIDNDNGTLSCVYSGYTINVPYGVSNPRDYTNAANPIINAEHSWPQSKGAGSGNPRSDMHHLFPTNAVPNSGRSSYPFGEVIDTQTDTWYRHTSTPSSIPSQFIDEYSELDNGTRFEVREDHKGNTARAMFYFYTMYKAEADQEDPIFFNIQKDHLRLWNSMDPVDDEEIARTNAIAVHQSNRANPFVLDTTLIGRAYFGVMTGLAPESNALADDITLHANYPNPFNPQTTIRFEVKQNTDLRLTIYDINGKIIKQLADGIHMQGEYNITWDATDSLGNAVVSGIYFYQLKSKHFRSTKKMFLIR